MKNCFNGFSFALALAIGFLHVAAPPAYAVATLQLSDGVTTITCADGQNPVVTPGCDVNPSTGAVTFSGSIGVFTVNVTTGVTFPTSGFGTTGADPAHLDLNSINISGGAGTLTMKFSEVGYTFTAGGFESAFGGTLNGPAGSSIQAQAFTSTTNNLFVQTTPAGSTGPFVTPGGLIAFAGTATGGAPLGAPYSVTQVLTLSLTGAGNFSGDFDMVQTPEPMSVALFGGMLLLTGAAIRRKAARRS